jgi:hypothetical protein
MLRASVAFATLLALVLPVAAVAQSAPVRTPITPRPVPTGAALRHPTGRYEPAVVIDPSRYLATPNPHRTPFHNQTHATIPAGETIFSSRSTSDHP